MIENYGLNGRSKRKFRQRLFVSLLAAAIVRRAANVELRCVKSIVKLDDAERSGGNPPTAAECNCCVPAGSAGLCGVATIPLHPTLTDVALRLLCAFVAGAIIGYNRGEHGKAAGLRTTLLVCLAAAVAMLQMNYLLTMAGKTSDSFISNDLMRLPLGILTGVGFIGGGAILRRRDLVVGVTTAATLWYVTVIGLCFGGDQILLGWLATGVGCVVLWAVEPIENFMTTMHHTRLVLTTDAAGPAEQEICVWLRDRVADVTLVNLVVANSSREYTFRVRELGAATHSAPPAVEELANRPGISAVHWSRLD